LVNQTAPIVLESVATPKVESDRKGQGRKLPVPEAGEGCLLADSVITKCSSSFERSHSAGAWQQLQHAKDHSGIPRILVRQSFT
jgi:hypothetical protein